MPPFRGVTAIAGIFFLAAFYLFVAAFILLLRPGTISLMAGSSLLGGLELAGPYMFLIGGVMATAIGLGIWRLKNWARRFGILVAITGIVMLVPTVSAEATASPSIALLWSGLGIIVRVVMIWYLFQAPVAKEFSSSGRSS
jgi:hypothetical protein